MSRFGPDPVAFFDSVYQGEAPWDVGGPQPALAALWELYPPPQPILDVGCGSGDGVVALAQRGYEVVGVDGAPLPSPRQPQRLRPFPPRVAQLVTLQVGDALQPTLLQRQFGAVVDCGFFHLFDPAVSDRFVEQLAATVQPQGYYYLLAFAVEFDIPHAPRAVQADEVRARFTPEQGWAIRALHSAEFHNRVAAPVPAIAACVQRLPTP